MASHAGAASEPIPGQPHEPGHASGAGGRCLDPGYPVALQNYARSRRALPPGASATSGLHRRRPRSANWGESDTATGGLSCQFSPENGARRVCWGAVPPLRKTVPALKPDTDLKAGPARAAATAQWGAPSQLSTIGQMTVRRGGRSSRHACGPRSLTDVPAQRARGRNFASLSPRCWRVPTWRRLLIHGA